MIKKYKWNEEKLQILKEYYPLGDFETLFRLLEINDKKIITGKAKQLRLRYKKYITEEDKDYIRDNYNKMPIEEIAKHIEKSIWTIYGLVHELGVGRYEWTDERIDIIKEIYPTGNWNLLFEKLKTTNKNKISQKASTLGIKVDGIDYSKEEIKYLKNNFEKLSCEEMATVLDRSPSSIYTKINRLRLLIRTKWTEEELTLLKEMYPYYTNDYIQKIYFPTRNSPMISQMAAKLGLHKSLEKSLKWYNKEELIIKLKNLATILGRTPRICELGIYDLPSEASFRRYFGSYLNACEIADLDIDYNLFGENKKYLYSSAGDRCYSKAELTITDFFISNNIKYKKEEHYRNYIEDNRCNTKKVDWVLEENIFVEYFGMPEKSYYYEKMQIKREICRDNDIRLIEIFFKGIKDLNIIFESFINKNP